MYSKAIIRVLITWSACFLNVNRCQYETFMTETRWNPVAEITRDKSLKPLCKLPQNVVYILSISQGNANRTEFINQFHTTIINIANMLYIDKDYFRCALVTGNMNPRVVWDLKGIRSYGYANLDATKGIQLDLSGVSRLDVAIEIAIKSLHKSKHFRGAIPGSIVIYTDSSDFDMDRTSHAILQARMDDIRIVYVNLGTLDTIARKVFNCPAAGSCVGYIDAQQVENPAKAIGELLCSVYNGNNRIGQNAGVSLPNTFTNADPHYLKFEDPIDIVMLFDVTNIHRPELLQSMIELATNLVKGFHTDQTNLRVSVITYTTTPIVRWHLYSQGASDEQVIADRLKQIRPSEGSGYQGLCASIKATQGVFKWTERTPETAKTIFIFLTTAYKFNEEIHKEILDAKKMECIIVVFADESCEEFAKSIMGCNTNERCRFLYILPYFDTNNIIGMIKQDLMFTLRMKTKYNLNEKTPESETLRYNSPSPITNTIFSPDIPVSAPSRESNWNSNKKNDRKRKNAPNLVRESQDIPRFPLRLLFIMGIAILVILGIIILVVSVVRQNSDVDNDEPLLNRR